jgi:uncharacterized protein
MSAGQRKSLDGGGRMKELVELIARSLVDRPDEVSVKEFEGEQKTVIELRVGDGDLGKVIGRQGRTARAIRSILGASGTKLKKRFVLDILE